jgi:Tfp pilus assembly protein PilP
LAFLVLLQAAKSAGEDLKATMEEVRRQNERESRRLQSLSISTTTTWSEWPPRGVSETGAAQTRLQMALDRMSKIMSTLSNILQKASSTSLSITKHLK